MAMKLFISQPMRGLADEEILSARQKAKEDVENMLGVEVEVLESFVQDAPADASPLWYLGESIKLLGQAELVYFVHGWEANRGCRIERMCAFEYGKSWMSEDEPPMTVLAGEVWE